jgi:hypothetical protein
LIHVFIGEIIWGLSVVAGRRELSVGRIEIDSSLKIKKLTTEVPDVSESSLKFCGDFENVSDF